MIGVYFQGRFGNQLFQYAFALSTSKKLNTDFFMDQSRDRIIINKYFKLDNYHSLRSWFRSISFGKRKQVIEVENSNTYSENASLLNNTDCFYKGYFQSEFYFKDIYAELKNEFSIKSKHKIDVRKVLKITNDKPLLVLHVRRTDYLKHGDKSMGGEDLSLPLNYYASCLSAVKDLENYNIVFVTDDEKFVKSNFSHLDPIVSSSKDLIVDFQILLNADVLVLANSSFSWWGAYLNSKCEKYMLRNTG